MIKLLNWLAGLRPIPCMKMVPIEADPPGPEFRSSMEDHKRFRAELKRLQSSAPPFLDGSLQRQILTICQDMQARAEAERFNAAQLREIAESLDGVVAAEQSSIPATTDSGQILVTPPKPQPSGGRLFIGGIEQPQPTGSETLLEMVGHAIAKEPWEDEAKGAVLAVARWLRTQGAYTAVALLEREAGE